MRAIEPGFVAPLAGAWVEITIAGGAIAGDDVAPLAGAWVEIDILWEIVVRSVVAPLAGAWVEIVCWKAGNWNADGRSPRGSVG